MASARREFGASSRQVTVGVESSDQVPEPTNLVRSLLDMKVFRDEIWQQMGKEDPTV